MMKLRNLFLIAGALCFLWVIYVFMRGYGFDYLFDVALFGIFLNPLAWYFSKRVSDKKKIKNQHID